MKQKRTRIGATQVWLAVAALALPLGAGAAAAVGPSPTGLYIVQFEEAPLPAYEGDLEGLEATNPRVRGEQKLDARSPASRAYLAYLEARQDTHVDRIEQTLGRPLEVRFRYQAAMNGIAAAMSPQEAARLETVAGVVSVTPDRLDPLDTDAGPTWIGADTIWAGTSTGALGGTRGEGVVVGIVDSGVNMDHPSFSDSPPDGHTYTNPNGSGVFLGACTGTSLPFPCNDKLIGAYDFADGFGPGPEADGPEDDNGHGSHTASTAAGNTLPFPAVSGVAPHANLITYDCCYTDAAGNGLCPVSSTTAGTNQAILDGVDVINYSIGGGNSPWNDSDANFLNAVNAGIFVAASAGNGGPGPNTSGHDGPWTMTVAASTHDRVDHQNMLSSMSGGTSPPSDITGSSMTITAHTDTIVYAGNFSNGDPNPEQCLSPFPAGTWNSDEIVVCDRGTISRVLKSQNAAAGGAGGMVLANIQGGSATTNHDNHEIPSVHIDANNGDLVRTWLTTPGVHTATITASSLVRNPALGDILAAFSSRGPVPGLDIVKPDVTNPGVSVFAAVNNTQFDDPANGLVYNGQPFFFLSGTSMSSPHTAGSAALLKALHPGWTPPEIKSALMTTALGGQLKEDGVTPADPFDVGAGRVDLTKAARAGLVLDETGANFSAANPALGGDAKTLNLASMANSACDGVCTWHRTVEDTTGGAITWTASMTGAAGLEIFSNPDPFSFPVVEGADTQVICIQARSDGTLPVGVWAFGELVLTPDDPDVPAAHFPVAINPSTTAEGISASTFESGTYCEWTSVVGGA